MGASVNRHQLRLALLPWVQAHYIERYTDHTLVSHNEAVEELCDVLGTTHEAKFTYGDTEALLAEWFQWWADTDEAPAKMPDALHVRTGMALLTRGVDVRAIVQETT